MPVITIHKILELYGADRKMRCCKLKPISMELIIHMVE